MGWASIDVKNKIYLPADVIGFNSKFVSMMSIDINRVTCYASLFIFMLNGEDKIA